MLKIESAVARVLNGYGISYNFRDLIYYINFLFFETQKTPIIKRSALEFDVVVLSLAKSFDRRVYIHNHLNELNIRHSILDSIDGEAQKDYIYRKLRVSILSKKYLPIGSLGGIISHMLAWENLLKSNWEMCLVLEDDVTLNLNYNEIKTRLSLLPDKFDLLYFGSGSYKGWFSMRKIEQFLLKPFSVRRGSYAYLITKEGARKLLESIQDIRITCGGIDTILGVLTMRKKIDTFHITPDIAEHLNIFDSSIKRR